MIANPHNILVLHIALRCRRRVMYHDGRCSSLHNMYRHIVCLGQCHDLWLPSPHGSIPDFGTVLKKLFWCHQPTLCRPCHVLAFQRGQKRYEVVWMCLDVVRCSMARCRVRSLRSWDDTQNSELVGNGREQTMSVRVNLSRQFEQRV